MKKTKDNIKTKIPLSKQGVALLTEEVLQVMNVLQSTLDINILLELFDSETRKISSHSYLSYKNSSEKINISFGEIIEEKLNSSLKNGSFDYNQEITINADIKIKELDISHSVSAKIYTPERDE